MRLESINTSGPGRTCRANDRNEFRAFASHIRYIHPSNVASCHARNKGDFPEASARSYPSEEKLPSLRVDLRAFSWSEVMAKVAADEVEGALAPDVDGTGP